MSISNRNRRLFVGVVCALLTSSAVSGQQQKASGRKTPPAKTPTAVKASDPRLLGMPLDSTRKRADTVALAQRTPVRPDSAAARPQQQPRRPSGRWNLEIATGGIYDTNIHHDEENLEAVGSMTSGAISYAARSGSWRYTVEGGAALHSYSHTDRFDRVGYSAGGRAEYRLIGDLSAGFALEGSLNGSDEERAVTDQLMLSPRLIFRFAGSGQLRLYAAQRFRKSNTSQLTANNRYAAVSLRTSGDQFIELSSRYEMNRTDLVQNEFNRWLHSARFTVPVGRWTELQAGVQYIDQRYLNRPVGDDGAVIIAPTRQDQRWKPQFAIMRRITDDIALELEYEYDRRTSSDPGKKYDAHNVALFTRFRR